MTGKTDFLGIKLTFYAVLAFALAMFGQTLLCGLLLGFSIWAVKDRWLARQTMQAFFLALISSIISMILDVFGIITILPFVGTMVDSLLGLANAAIKIIIFILALVALTRVARGEEADVPLVNQLADKAFAPED